MTKAPLIMGILNITDDSFSDGGLYLSPDQALRKALELQKEGADIIDIGAEASGPNSKGITSKQELERLEPLLKKLIPKLKIPVSIDTYKADVADACLTLGTKIINDITALRGDKKMAAVIAKHKATVVLMYSKDSTARTTVHPQTYKDVMGHITKFHHERIKYAQKHGIKPSQIWLDPGLGHFISSHPKYSFEIIAHLGELKKALKKPILLGISRKSFLGGPLEARDPLAAPLNAIAYQNGASIIRTHDVKGTIALFKHLNS